MAKRLESGQYLLSNEEVSASKLAADFLRQRLGLDINLQTPVAFDDWMLVLTARLTLDGHPEAVDLAIEHIEAHLRRRDRPH